MMKKKVLFVVALCAVFSSIAQTLEQNIEIKNSFGAKINSGDTIYVGVEINDFTVIHLDVKNIFTDTLKISLKRKELTVPANTANYFCWGTCFSPFPTGTFPLWTSTDPETIASGQTNNSFGAYYDHLIYDSSGIGGDASFRYTWYMENNPSDSLSIYITFQNFNTSGVNSKNLDFVKIQPNPVTKYLTVVGLENNNFNYSIWDILGNEVAYSRKYQSSKIDVSSLDKGIYFITFYDNGKDVLVKKFIKH